MKDSATQALGQKASQIGQLLNDRSLANYSWDDPIIRASQETEFRNVKITTPLMGEVFRLKNLPHSKRWEMIENRAR